MSAKRCGPHVELANNPTVRVTRCPCGTVHLHMIPSGVTLKMPTEAFRAATSAMTSAAEKIDVGFGTGFVTIN